MTEETQEAEETAAEPKGRRRASRAAGPAGDAAPLSAGAAPAPAPGTAARGTRPAAPPPRRRADSRRVALVAAVGVLAAVTVLGALVAVLVIQQRRAEAVAARERLFVDTAAQSVVNMFSYTDATVEESVNRFVAGTSGPLRDMIGGNADNLKALFRATHIANSEVVVNGAALEGIDDVADNGSVLVATRVTVTDLDGVTKPSQPFRLRVIVHEDDAGNMTAYDLKYPDGGN